jgi:hypothetical protein
VQRSPIESASSTGVVIAAVKSVLTVAGQAKPVATVKATAIATPSPAQPPASRGDNQAGDRADGAQDQPAVGLFLLGSQYEEDRQRDSEAVFVHADEPVDRHAAAQGATSAGRRG